MPETLLAILLAVVPPPETPCPPCERADSLAARGDTAAAVALLRREAPGSSSAEVWGTLGLLLTRIAPAKETDFTLRDEAEDALDRAFELDPDDPRWYFARGLLLRKRGIRVDAERLFDRAVERDERAPDGTELTPRERAEVHAARGRILEEHVLDFRGLVTPADHVPVTTPECGGEESAFCRNFSRPEAFHEQLFLTDTQEGLVADEAREMRREFETAFDLDPSLPAAARGLLATLARAGEWQRFVEVAGRHAEAVPGAGWAWTFLGAGHFRTGDPAAARGAFARARDLLPDAEREVLEDITAIIDAEAEERYRERPPEQREAYEDLLWKVSDPLYLTDVNERRLEHLTRTAVAEILYGDPLSGRRGYETDRGLIYIRYGRPRWVHQIRRDETRARAAEQSLSDLENPGRSVGPSAQAGGRWVFWTYRENMPSFIFEKHLTSRSVEHAAQTLSGQFAEDARAELPSAYALPDVRDLPHQIVRFRSDEVDVELDLYALLPADTTGVVREGEAGLFFLPRTSDDEVVGLRSSVRFAGGRRIATFRAPLDADRYRYSVEAMSEDGSLRARARGTADLTGFPVEGFGISDLLLARQIVPREPGSEVEDRRDLRVAASGDLRFEAASPLALYFEVYDIEFGPGEGEAGPDDPPVGSYRVTVEVTDAEDEGVLGRVIRGIGGLLGSAGEGTEITWERTVEGPRERIPEWFTLTLPEIEPGEYSVRVTVEDLRADEEIVTERAFELTPF